MSYQARGGSRGGFGGNGSRGGRGGGSGAANRNKAVVTMSNTILPYGIVQLGMDASPMGWTIAALKPPSNKGVGTIKHRGINLILNMLESKIVLPRQYLFQYDIDIDLDEESKLAKKLRKAKDEQQQNGKGRQNGKNGHESPDEGHKDPPRPVLWKKLVLKTISIIENWEKELFQSKGYPNPTILAMDGMKSIYTARPIRSTDASNVLYIPIKLKELGDGENSEDGYVVTVKGVARVATAEVAPCINNLKEWLMKGQRQLPNDFTNVDRIYNIVLKTPPMRTLISIGKASFFPIPEGDGFLLGGGLVNWTGFSLHYMMGWKPFVTVDVANSAFILGRNVNEVLKDVHGGADPTNILKWTKENFASASHILKGCQVSYVLAQTGQKLTRRVSGISDKIARDHTFSCQGTEKNVQEYFEIDKGMKLQYKTGLCLEMGKSVVPAEFCTIQKGQAWRHKLTDNQTANMIKDTAKGPAERLQVIRDVVKQSNFNSQPVLKEFGVSVAGNLLQLESVRILPPPTLVYGMGPNQQARLVPGAEGVWDMFAEGIKFVQPYNKGKSFQWGILNLAPRFCTADNVYDFIVELIRIGSSSGLNLGNANDLMSKHYTGVEANELHPSVPQYLEGFFTHTKSMNYKFILVITPRKETTIYAHIKIVAELETLGGVLTQCIVAPNIKKRQASTVGNVLLKLNMKLGGVNNLLYIEGKLLSRINILRAPVMIMGADVTHPGRDSKLPSLAAVTASTDRTGMPFMMCCQAQRVAGVAAAEIITELDVIVKKMITRFISTTGHKPRKIIFYRDGVGDCQFEEVLSKEMLMIRKGCRDLEKDPSVMNQATKDLEFETPNSKLPFEPQITFIAVQKRHKTRFFPQDPRDGVGRPQNAPPGTVVDTLIVNPNCMDFYLLSHTGIQGTSRPTRYQLLWDDSNFSIDEIEVLTYYLCYCYCRCNRSVSYPAPTYYAHLAATRAKVFTHGLSDAILEDIERLNGEIERQPELLRMNPMHFV